MPPRGSFPVQLLSSCNAFVVQLFLWRAVPGRARRTPGPPRQPPRAAGLEAAGGQQGAGGAGDGEGNGVPIFIFMRSHDN